MAKDTRLALITAASAAVNKMFGPGTSGQAIRELTEVSIWASTGSLALDRALGGGWLPGGIPMGPRIGRTIHIFGDPSLGKSALLDWIIWHVVMELKGLAIVSETEGSRDPHWAKAMGLDMRFLEIQRPDNIELLFDQGLEWIFNIRRKDHDIPIVWGVDSMSMIGTKKSGKELMSEGGGWHFGGGKSEAWGEGLNRVTAVCSTSQTTFVLLNQMREVPARPGQKSFGGPIKKPTGGWPSRYAASMEVRLTSSKLGMVKRTNRVIARWIHANVVKNKVRNPHVECDFLINFETGVSQWAGVFEMLEAEELVHIKRNKDGTPASNEFVVRKTGEVKPISEFAQWCNDEQVLHRVPESIPQPVATDEHEAEETDADDQPA